MDHNQIMNEIANADLTLTILKASTEQFIHLYDIEDFEIDCGIELRNVFAKCHYIVAAAYIIHNNSHKIASYLKHHDAHKKLLKCISVIYSLQKYLENTGLAFKIDEYYDEIFRRTEGILSPEAIYGIDLNEEIKIPIKIPIFTLSNTININHTSTNNSVSKLHKVGKGSYAAVYKFYDSFLNKELALKVANRDLSENEHERFALEFKTLAKLNSLYIVEVYNFNKESHRYTMEYMPYNFYKYNELHNPSPEIRRKIALQILSASEYIISKGLFHRDLSPNNVLIRDYKDGSVVAKLSDFGLVKNPDFQLTNFDTNPKGTFIAPELSSGHISFKQYSIKQEVYALTRLLFFIITGQYAPDEHTPTYLKKAYNTGTHSDQDQRPDNIATVKALFFNKK
jgi:hypothetical protein